MCSACGWCNTLETNWQRKRKSSQSTLKRKSCFFKKSVAFVARKTPQDNPNRAAVRLTNHVTGMQRRQTPKMLLNQFQKATTAEIFVGWNSDVCGQMFGLLRSPAEFPPKKTFRKIRIVHRTTRNHKTRRQTPSRAESRRQETPLPPPPTPPP